MTREYFIERLRRIIYNGQPPDDASITESLVNAYINDGIGTAIKTHILENIRSSNISLVSNSFYATIRGLPVSIGDEFGYYTCTLPSIPMAIGGMEIASARLYDSSNISKPLVQMNVHQINQWDNLPQPNAIPFWNENNTLIFNNPSFPLNGYSVAIRMIYAGDSTDITTQMNIPDEWLPTVQDYVIKTLLLEKEQPKTLANDGTDNVQK